MEEKETTKKRRKKGAGSIMRKANGTYLGRITILGYEPFSCTGATKKEVERKLEEFKIRTLKKEIIPQRIFVSSYIESWLENVKKPSLKASSFDRLERTYLTQIKDSRVGRCQLGNITSMDVQGLINEKSRTLSYSSLKKIYELLNGCFEYAVICREMDFNPVRAVQMPKKENLNKKEKQMSVFSKEELVRIEDVAAITYQSGEVRYKHVWFFILLANTGLRAGDDDDKIRLNQRKPSKYKGLSRFGPEKNLQRINKFMKERPIFYKNLIQMKENFRFYLRCFYCITKVVILQFNSENRTELARNG